MYPAVRALYKEVPAFSTNRHFFFVCFAAGLDDLWQQVFLLVSVSFICSCACVGLIYRSSICSCVTFILFVFREQKIVQRIQEIVAKYEDRLRKMQSVPWLSYGRSLVCTDGVLYVDFLTERRTINAEYYSALLERPVKAAIRNKRKRAQTCVISPG